MAERVRWAAWSCSHSPLTDEDSFKEFLRVLREWKPDKLVCLGDLLDGSPASKHPNEDVWSLEEEFRHAASVLNRAAEACGPSLKMKVWLHGNHDENVLSPNRLPPRLRSLLDWRNTRTPLAEAVLGPSGKGDGTPDGGWREIPYSHRQVYRIGQAVFQHGAETSGQAGRNLAQLYAPEHGILVFGHTHRPVPPTEAMLNPKISLRRWWANAGCLVDWDRLEYARRMNITEWGHACVVGWSEVGEKRVNFHSKRWHAETILLKKCGSGSGSGHAPMCGHGRTRTQAQAQTNDS